MTTVMPRPRFDPEKHGLRAAQDILDKATTRTSGDRSVQVGKNEVVAGFAMLDFFMPEGRQVSLETSLTYALRLLQKDLTKDGIDAVFARFDIKPQEPVIDPDDPNVIRPRYGLMETARPIIDRVNAGGANEEDVARLRILKALADRGAIEPTRVRGRAFAPSTGVRALGGASEAAAVSSAIGEAIARAGSH